MSDDADFSSTTSEDKGDFEKVKTFIRETNWALIGLCLCQLFRRSMELAMDMSVKEAAGLNATECKIRIPKIKM